MRMVVRRVSEALQYMHAQGFVHRDVKLENLLLKTPGDLASLKLADFGFATAVSPKGKGYSYGAKVRRCRLTPP